jgi:hypothetical protein
LELAGPQLYPELGISSLNFFTLWGVNSSFVSSERSLSELVNVWVFIVLLFTGLVFSSDFQHIVLFFFVDNLIMRKMVIPSEKTHVVDVLTIF